MPKLRQVLAVSLLTSITVGTAVALALLLLAPTPPDLGSGSMTLGLVQLAGAVGLAGLASAPVSIPLGLAGGGLARWAFRRQNTHLTTTGWVSKGTMAGALLGGLGSALYSASFNGAASAATLMFLAVGAFAGTICGIVVGWWCARQAAAAG